MQCQPLAKTATSQIRTRPWAKQLVRPRDFRRSNLTSAAIDK